MRIRLFDGARASRAARRDARQFAASVREGTTYYSTEHADHPWGPETLVREWKFRWSRSRQAWVCGSVTAGGAWLGWGPLTTHRPSGRLLTERSENLHDPLKGWKDSELRELDAVR
ncbi:hypothetical protein ACLIYM_25280 [Streptomyces fenghuangensis]